MSAVGEKFQKAFGKPDPSAPDGLPNDTAGGFWERLRPEVGSGYFLDRFLYLFGEGLQELTVCLKSWSFIVPSHEDRVILGFNAYGSLLVLEDGQDPSKERVYVLDPLHVTYTTRASCDFVGLLGSWLPEQRLPNFFDTSVYTAWGEENGTVLDPREILGIGVPLSLDGEMELENFAPQDIVEYYATTGPTYAKAMRKK